MHVYVECSMTSRGPRAGGAGEVSGGDGRGTRPYVVGVVTRVSARSIDAKLCVMHTFNTLIFIVSVRMSFLLSIELERNVDT